MSRFNKIAYMETLGTRLKARRKALKLTQKAVGDYVGITAVSVSLWESDHTEPRGKNLDKLCQLLQCKQDWLLYGVGEGETPPQEGLANVSPGPDPVEQVPLLGYTTAGAFKHVRELEKWEVEDWYPTIKRLNGQGFALRIEGDSMTSPYGRSYPDGSIAIFNAGNRNPSNGELVLAKINGSDEITFKKYVTDAGNTWLAPLNPNYPTLHVEFRVLAVFEHALVF